MGALLIMLFFALAELGLFITIGGIYFTLEDGNVSNYHCALFGYHFRSEPINLTHGVQAQAIADTRDAIGSIMYPSFIACLLMVLFITINTCMCCCASNKMYYGALMATGLVILVGTAVMTSRESARTLHRS